jgi:hypothetical protein
LNASLSFISWDHLIDWLIGNRCPLHSNPRQPVEKQTLLPLMLPSLRSLFSSQRSSSAFYQRFPTINVHPEFYLGAYYAGTHDGLPIIGVYDEYPNCYFVYAYGDNGAVYSMVLAKCLRDWIAAGQSDNAQLYLPERPLVSTLSS